MKNVVDWLHASTGTEFQLKVEKEAVPRHMLIHLYMYIILYREQEMNNALHI